MTFERFDVVVVPFPFTDLPRSKRRPALVLSSRAFGAGCEHSVMAMITSSTTATWPLDIPLQDPARAGLDAACLVRMKLFTLDHRLVLRVAGRLGDRDRSAVESALGELLAP